MPRLRQRPTMHAGAVAHRVDGVHRSEGGTFVPHQRPSGAP